MPDEPARAARRLRLAAVSGFFVSAYAGLAIPTLGVGIASQRAGFFRATLVCSIVLAALLGTVALRTLRRAAGAS
jgi:hypothetical protein